MFGTTLLQTKHKHFFFITVSSIVKYEMTENIVVDICISDLALLSILEFNVKH